MQVLDIVPWDDNFNTGLELVDTQHRQLVKLVNKVATDLAYNSGEIDLTALFADLIAYTNLHFGDEEQVWARHFAASGEAEAHKKQHGRFFSTVDELVASAAHRPTRDVAEQALSFLTEWLVAHVLGADRHLAYIVKGMGRGLTREQAVAEAADEMARFRKQTASIVMTAYGHLSRNTLALMRELARRQTLIDELRVTRAQLLEANRQYEQTQAQLGRDHGLLQAVLNALPDVIWLQDEGGAVLASNDRYTTATEHSRPREPSAAGVVTSAADAAPSLGQMLATVAEAARASCERQVITTQARPRDDAAARHFEISCGPIGDDDERRFGCLGVAHDITEHHRLTARLKAESELTQQYLDTVQVIILSLNGAGEITMINRKGCEVLGRTKEELLGRDWFSTCLPQPEGTDQILPLFRSFMAGEVASLEFTEHEIVTASGERRLIAWHNTVVRDASGAIRVSLSAGEDVTEQRQLSRTVEEERRRLANIIWSTDVGTWEWNLQTGEVLFNERWAQIIGYTLAELEPCDLNTWPSFVHPDDLAVAEAAIARYRNGERRVFEVEVRMRHRDGHWVWVADRGKVVEFDDTGEALWMSGTHTDISAQKAKEMRLRQAANVFEYATEGILICDAEERIVDVNRAFTTITGYAPEDVLGLTPRVLASGRHDVAFYEDMWASIEANDHWEGEVWNRRRSGQVFAEHLTISTVRRANGTVSGYVGLFSDVTELKHHQSRLEHLAHFDVLTNLPNRVLLADRLQLAIERARRSGTTVAVAYLDLDGFKAINDRHGHAAGDRLLVEVASRMRAALRSCDTLSRMGGDEFVAVLPDLPDAATSVAIIHRLLEAASTEIAHEGEVVRVTASIGVTFWQHQADLAPDQLIRQADQAMYQVKESGKNSFHIFDAARGRAVRGQHQQLARIGQALRDGELRLHYQPKVNMRTGAVRGMEALIRWQHPELGLLPPARFLPQIEGHKLNIDVGDWVINAALAQMSAWREEGYAISVSVNIDGQHLQRPGFVAALQAALARHPNVPPGDLELEVLETSALGDTRHVSAVLSQCRALGATCAIDDFGTGHASLTYLKLLPADLIKIDQSFVRDMLDDPDDLAILDGVLGLATSFRREVIAEGVEELAHGVMLLRMGCELGQGYAIARPMAAEQVPGWLTTWRPPAVWANQATIAQAHQPLVTTIVYHRAWVKSHTHHEAVSQTICTALDGSCCALHDYLASADTSMPAVAALVAAHEQLNERARHLHAQAAQDDIDATKAALNTQLSAFEQAVERLLAEVATL